MRAENIKNYVNQNVKIAYWGNWEEAIPTGEGFTYEKREGFVTIEGKVFLHEGNAMILQQTGEVNQFLNNNTEIKLEVL
ncbi:hypothetical protein PQE70_gp008 [Bacillus phage vB_BanS_Nate]|uniref:Uncharacterized protein n=1 Tax=Bacillus phage vB_BanS_Nate TaxID=2894788 RepID=A0AAE8YVM8_9CAUD|nr:hypothetical protein PQE70_gp008 [Bacillus phage vB_BanS_Nate]UGO50861.1 hypothetical protein NATE_8 [Bacillus phage vB_BanS_Nate]